MGGKGRYRRSSSSSSSSHGDRRRKTKGADSPRASGSENPASPRVGPSKPRDDRQAALAEAKRRLEQAQAELAILQQGADNASHGVDPSGSAGNAPSKGSDPSAGSTSQEPGRSREPSNSHSTSRASSPSHSSTSGSSSGSEPRRAAGKGKEPLKGDWAKGPPPLQRASPKRRCSPSATRSDGSDRSGPSNPRRRSKPDELEDLQHRLAVALSENDELQRQLARVGARRDEMLAGRVLATVCKKPDEFTGTSRDSFTVQQWLNSVKHYLRLTGVKRHHRVGVAVTMLAPVPRNFWLTSDMPASERKLWKCFAAFMKRSYGGPDPESVARHQLDALRQDGSIEKYHRRFIDLCARITVQPLSEGDKLHRFIKGMQRQLADRIAVDPVTELPWKSFAECAQYALSCGTNLHLYVQNHSRTVANGERDGSIFGDGGYYPTHRAGMEGHGARGRREQGSRGRSSSRQPSRPPEHGRERGHRPKQDRSGSEERRRAEKERLFREGRCLHCKELGHIAKNCPKKPSADQQGNKGGRQPHRQGGR